MFVGSYLWRLRQRIGHDLVLMPGVMVVVEDAAGRVLLQRRRDTGEWCLPGGAAEVGGSFGRTAVAELREETGLDVAESALTAFGCVSAAEVHTIHYPNGDVTHCFALCLVVRDWLGDPAAADAESTAVGFFDRAALPEPMHGPAAAALDLYAGWLETGRFQLA